MFHSPALRRQLSVLLLLLFGRVLAPESLVLALHAHAHTQDEHAHTTATIQKGKPQLSPKHQHCHEEQFYDSAFQPALPICVGEPIRRLTYAEYHPLPPMCRASHLLDGPCLRGPPARCA